MVSHGATAWMPKLGYAINTTKNRSLSLADVLQGGSFLMEGIPYFLDGVVLCVARVDGCSGDTLI